MTLAEYYVMQEQAMKAGEDLGGVKVEEGEEVQVDMDAAQGKEEAAAE